MNRIYSILCLLFSAGFLHSQTTPLDTVFLMSGKTVQGIVKDSTDEQLKILTPTKKGNFKADFVDLDLVYSVKYAKDGSESVFYKQDTLFGNYFTPQEVKYFIYGERDSRAYYHCRMACAGAFLFGAAGGYSQSFFLTFLPPFIYSGASTFFRVKIKPGSVSNPENIKYDTYVLGYEKDARQRRLARTLLWGGIGMVAGFAMSGAVNGFQK
ncbi:MAG: hypothetical protein HY064_08150 [Bacteroidetes bacterium]|nr:hypothetical protein [Bacteroidota bacterium]